MTTLYGLKSCDSCRKARAWLDKRSIEYAYHDVRKDGLTAARLRQWSKQLGWETLLNKRSLTWRNVPESDREGLNEARALAMLVEFPTLLKRPIMETEDGIEVGFSPQRYETYFDGDPD